MSQRPQVIPVTDAGVLKGMAHPLRARLYYALFARGTARATDLAEELDSPVNLVSQHLRFMAKYGLIEEAPELARDKRERVWRPASTMGLRHDPDLTAGTAFEEAAQAGAHHTLDAFLTRARPGFHHSNDVTMYLSQAEAEEFAHELQDFLFRWNQRGQDQDTTDPDTDRTTFLATVFIQPLPAD